MFSQQICSDVFTGSPWMSPLVKSLLKKKSKIPKDWREKLERSDREDRTDYCWKSPSFGFWEAWIASLVEKIEQLTMHKDKSSSSLDQQFINGLNDYIGDLCLNRNYIKPVPAEIDVNTPVPQLSTAQVFQTLSQILKAYCYRTWWDSFLDLERLCRDSFSCG